ncbi:hypothetical protein [Anaerotignum sp. MB30-C6]|uniref:hypothetical protein n=1 Tax=Anaerotignum sp. MB30-C6 TaxID=3070814 RepID=UPI0027DC4BA8|nr:hypothetical protein [Anaerotignum sp. MB30-C6]WMI81825.1 hypothetical protein RBQ60_03610 [Anaerotignum sp. MB30-C6]
MERLTERNERGFAYLKNVKPNEQDVESPYPNTLRCILDCFEQLAKYEDKGLTPDEIKQLQTENASLRARLDKAVELPCKVGDTVYMVFDGLIKVLIVESIHCWKSGKWRISAHTDKTNKYWAGYEIDPKGFGIKFFLAEAEAQAKLDEMKGGAS